MKGTCAANRSKSLLLGRISALKGNRKGKANRHWFSAGSWRRRLPVFRSVFHFLEEVLVVLFSNLAVVIVESSFVVVLSWGCALILAA